MKEPLGTQVLSREVAVEGTQLQASRHDLRFRRYSHGRLGQSSNAKSLRHRLPLLPSALWLLAQSMPVEAKHIKVCCHCLAWATTPGFLQVNMQHAGQRLSPRQAPVLRRGGGRKCRLQFSLSHGCECVNCRIPRLGPRFVATSCKASHACPCLFPLDTDSGNCRKTCPTIMRPPPLLHLLSAGGLGGNDQSESACSANPGRSGLAELPLGTLVRRFGPSSRAGGTGRGRRGRGGSAEKSPSNL